MTEGRKKFVQLVTKLRNTIQAETGSESGRTMRWNNLPSVAAVDARGLQQRAEARGVEVEVGEVNAERNSLREP
jgi:hypothetical protein